MKSFITFLKETDLNPYQKDWVRSLYIGRESIPPRIVHDSDYHPVGVGGHHLFNLHAGNRGPINLPDYGGEYGNRRDNYLKARKHELSKHVFDPSNPDIPGSVHNGPEHPNTVRIIPFEVQKMEPHPDLIRHLGDHGYDIHDFENGLAIKRGGKNKERIGKILEKTKPSPTDAHAWMRWSTGSKHFERSRELHSLAQTHEIMISKDPFHIAEQSTGKRTWSSCLTLPNRDGDPGGCNYRHLVGDILGGTHAAYLIPKGSYAPNKPLKAVARMTLRQYNNGDHSILRPAGSVYGFSESHPVAHSFRSALSSFTDKHFPLGKDKLIYHVERHSPSGHEIYIDSATDHMFDPIDEGIRSSHKEVAMAAVQHPEFGRQHFWTALNSPHKEVAMATLHHPHFDDFDNAFQSPHKEVAMAAMEHPNFRLTRHNLNYALSSPHKEVAMAAIQHPEFGSGHNDIERGLLSRHKEVQMAALQHPNFGSAPTNFEDAFRSEYKEVAMAATKHPKFGGDKAILAALKSPYEEVQMAATKHPNFGFDYRHFDQGVRSYHKEVAMAVVRHPEFGPSHVDSALSSPHKDVAMAAVQHPKFGVEHINKALSSRHKEVAMAAIQHPEFGSKPQHISHAINGYHKEVQMAAVQHPNFGLDDEHMNLALTSPDEELQMAAVKHPNFGSGIHHIPNALSSRYKQVTLAAMKHPEFGSDHRHFERVLRSVHSVAMAAVEHPKFGSHPDHILHALASPHEEVVRKVVQHPNFGLHNEHISLALNSGHEEVAMAAVRHPKFGSDIHNIPTALHSLHKEVAMAAIQHPNFGSDYNDIEHGLYSPHKEVQMAALQHPNFGAEHINQALRSRHKEVAMAAMQHPNFGAEHINQALSSYHKEVAMAALQHPNFGAEHINQALRSTHHKEVAIAAMQHPEFGSHPSHFNRAIYSQHKDVAMAAIEHPKFNTNLEHISRIIEQDGTVPHLPRLPKSIKDALVAKHNAMTGGKQNNLENYQMKSFTQLLSEIALTNKGADVFGVPRPQTQVEPKPMNNEDLHAHVSDMIKDHPGIKNRDHEVAVVTKIINLIQNGYTHPTHEGFLDVVDRTIQGLA